MDDVTLGAPSAGRASGVLAAAALVVTWSSGFVGGELGARAGAVPVTLLGWRFVLLAVVLVVAAAITRMSWPRWRAWCRQGLLALLCQVGYLYFVFEGVSHGVHGGTAALIAALQPMLVATVAGPLLGERSGLTTWLGMLLGLGGVLVVVSGDVSTVAAPAPAVYLLPTAGMLSLTVGTVLTRRLRPTETLQQSVTMQAVVTAALMMGAALITGQANPPRDPDFWRAVIWLMILASLGGYLMYLYVIRTRGATVVSTLLYLTPPTTMVWVFIMFGEPITLTDGLGLAVSGAGVLLVLRAQRPRPDRRRPGAPSRPDSPSPDKAEEATDLATRPGRDG